MKQNLILSLLLLFSLTSWAQYNDASTSKEELKIPIKPIVVEGELTNVPDGTIIQFAFKIRKTRVFDTGFGTLVDTVRNGKFHIEKKWIYKDSEDNDDNFEYMLSVEGQYTSVYVNHGDTVIVTGDGLPCNRWHVENNHPLQKIYNDCFAFIGEITAPISKKIQEAYEADDVDDELIKKLETMKDSTIIVSTLDYMEGKEFNAVFAHELAKLGVLSYLRNRILGDRISRFINEKVPASYKDDGNIQYAKLLIAPANGKLNIGDRVPEFTLYDRDDKEHKLSEFVGKKIVLLQFCTYGCGPCQVIQPEVEEFYAKHKDKCEVITISCDDLETWKNEKKVSWPDWNDHASGTVMGEKFDISGYPYYVLIRSDGVIGSTFLGIGKVREYFKSFDF